MKSPHTSPPASPLQKMKVPFIRRESRRMRNPLMFRARVATRASLTVVVFCVLLFVWNELKCLHFGCLSRTGFYGASESDEDGGGYVGGGAVIPKFGKQGGDEEDERGVLEGSERTRGAAGAWWWKPNVEAWVKGDDEKGKERERKEETFSESLGTLVTTEEQQAAKDQADPEEEIEHKDRKLQEVLEKMKMAYFDGKPNASSTMSSEPVPSLTSTPRENVARESSSPAPVPKPTPTMSIADTEVSWEGREDDPPPINELETQLQKPGSHSKATWQQSEGQEDPVRVPRPSRTESGSSSKDGEQMKLGVMDMGALGITKP